MPKRNLTELGITRIKAAPRGKRVEYHDGQAPGLTLRVTDKGHKSWSVYYYRGIKHQRITLRYRPADEGTSVPPEQHDVRILPNHTLAEARQFARWAKGVARQGDDPKHELEVARRARASAARESEVNTVDSVVKRFTKEKKNAKRLNRSWRETSRIFDHDVLEAVTGTDPRPWRKRPIQGIGQRDVIELLDGFGERVYMRNRVLATVRKLFNWSAAKAIVDSVPKFKGLAAPEESRDRILNESEVKAVWNAAAGYPFGAGVRFMLATGARRSEVFGLSWAELDVEKRIWTIPSERAKNGVRLELPLNDLAVEVLESLPRFPGPHVFSTTAGEKAYGGYTKGKAALDTKIAEAAQDNKAGDENEPWRLHDIRRTVGSGLQALRFSSGVIGACLNHAKGGGATPIYMRHSYTDEKREAMDAWGGRLESIVRPTPGNVVPLHG